MKSALALLLALTATASLSAQVFLTNFGSDSFDDWSSPSLTQTASTGTFNGDLMTAFISGDFSPLVNITGFTSALSFTATVFDNPGTGFKITLYDANSDVYDYEGVLSDFTTGTESTIRLNAISGQTDPFDFTQVTGLEFAFDSGSSEQLHATFSGLSAVPEPSTYAALVGLISLGGALLRRRRRA